MSRINDLIAYEEKILASEVEEQLDVDILMYDENQIVDACWNIGLSDSQTQSLLIFLQDSTRGK